MTRMCWEAPLVLIAALVPLCAAWGQADANLVTNGDFDQVRAGRPVGWAVDAKSAKVACEQVGGKWNHNAFTFNSGKYERIRVGFYMAPGANGSVWIDNLRSSPKLAILNPSFEKIDANGDLKDWRMERTSDTLYTDAERVSQGKRSFRITYKAAEPASSRITQFVAVKPNTDYRITFDVYVGDDFLGALRPNIYAGVPGSPHITGPDWAADDIVNERGRFGERLALALEDGTAEISQNAPVPPGRNLEASVAVRTSGLEGHAALVVVDAKSGETLGEAKTDKADADWERMSVRFASVSQAVAVRLTASGTGGVKLADATIATPRLTPPAQEIEWPDASSNVALGKELTVSVEGPAGRVIEKGLAMLAEETGAVRRIDAGLGDIDISIIDAFGLTDRGEEAYTLVVGDGAVRIESATEKGAFHALMTLLQLVTDGNAGKEILACRAADWPDMPVRAVALTGGSITGDAVKDLDVMARMKFNTAVMSLGTYDYPTNEASRAGIQKCLDAGADYGIEVIPLQTTLGWGYHVLKRNPNLVEGRWIRDEKLTLAGTKPVPLAHRNVIRTELTDIVVTSADGKTAYKADVDYRVIPGETTFENYRFSADAKPWAIARIEGGSIGGGAHVLASYDCVGRSGKGRYAYCASEGQVGQLMGDWIEQFARDWPFPGNFICIDELHDRFYIDSRCIASGKSASEILSEHLHLLAERAKKGNPDIRLWMWGDMVDPHDAAASIGAEDIGPMLPKDIVQIVWGYSANVPRARGLKGVEHFGDLGISTLVCGWYDTNNIRQWAQVVRKARERGLPCLGYLACVWHQHTEGLEESAICSWRIPREGEKRYEPID